MKLYISRPLTASAVAFCHFCLSFHSNLFFFSAPVPSLFVCPQPQIRRTLATFASASAQTDAIDITALPEYRRNAPTAYVPLAPPTTQVCDNAGTQTERADTQFNLPIYLSSPHKHSGRGISNVFFKKTMWKMMFSNCLFISTFDLDTRTHTPVVPSAQSHAALPIVLYAGRLPTAAWLAILEFVPFIDQMTQVWTFTHTRIRMRIDG